MNKVIKNDSAFSPGPTDLSTFMRSHPDKIIQEWTAFARSLTPAAHTMTVLQLQDHIKDLLDFIAADLESRQSSKEQVEKSHGEGPESAMKHSAAQIHAALRLSDGFNIDQMVSEYRALRASVVKLWTASKTSLNHQDFEDLTRFNEAVDQALTESISHYTKILDHSRNMFLGILGHDLRNPIGAASLSAQLIVRMGPLSERQAILAAQIEQATDRATQIVSDLLDLTRAGFGTELPITKNDMELSKVARKLVDEMTAAFDRDITLKVSGDTRGKWDEARLGQVFSNLIGNAVQYSVKNTQIGVHVEGGKGIVTIEVHNFGDPIPPEKRTRIFDALTRGSDPHSENVLSANLGLGLYITNKIVTAHGGTITIPFSDDRNGTVFAVKLPRE